MRESAPVVVVSMPLAIGVPPIEAIVRRAQFVPVFPCRRANEQIGDTLYKAKSPLTKHGLKDASQDPDQIRAWWKQWPDALVGVPTGSVTNLVVVDYDSHKADEAAQAFIIEHTDEWMATRSHQTLNGGRHYLFRPPAGVKYRSGANVVLGNVVRTGIDIRAEGGYIIWWPLHGALAEGKAAPLPAGLIDERRIEERELPPLPKATPESWARDAQRVADALAYLDPQDYDKWIQVGMGIHYATQGSDAGFDLWHTWSGGGLTGDLPHNYSGIEDCRYKWASFGSNSSRPVTLGSLFAAAQARGYSFQAPVPNLPPLETPPIEAYSEDEAAPRTQSRGDVEAGKPQVDPFEALPASQLASTAVRQVVQKLFAGVTVVGGAPNSGKSAFMTDAACFIASGVPFFGRKVMQGPVLYVAAEAPGSIVMRVRANQGAKFHGEELPIHIVRDIPRLGNEVDSSYDCSRLLATAQLAADAGAPYVLTIWDTAAMMLGGGDENGSGMILLMECARRFHEATGAVVVIVHHPSKADPAGLRGHGSMTGAADSIVLIEQDELTKIRTAKVVKGRDFATGDEIRFNLEVFTLAERDQFGDPATTVIVRPTDEEPVQKMSKGVGANQRAAIGALKEWARTHDSEHISTIELTDLLDAAGIKRPRRYEVISSLASIGILIASVGGHRVTKGLL